MKKLSRSGFGTIEAVLFVVLFLGLAVVGYSVWKTQADKQRLASVKTYADCIKSPGHQSFSTADPTCTTKDGKHFVQIISFRGCKDAADSKLLETYPEQCVTKDGKTFTDPTQSATQYLTIKEWGVRMKLTPQLSSAYYYIPANLPDVAYLSIRSIITAAPKCAADQFSIGALFRVTVAEQQKALANPSVDNGIPGNIKIDDYYYGYDPSHAACFDSSNSAAESIWTTLDPRDGFMNAEKTLEAAPTKYLTIKEWGVKGSYSADDTLTYTIGAGNKLVTVISSNLAAKDPGCARFGAGQIARLTGGENAYTSGDGPTVAQNAVQNPGLYIHIGNYYYQFIHDQAACSSPTTVNINQNQANDETKALVSKLQAE